jgi:hypothetical protein
MQFRRSAAGAIDALVFHEPTSIYIAERDDSENTTC